MTRTVALLLSGAVSVAFSLAAYARTHASSGPGAGRGDPHPASEDNSIAEIVVTAEKRNESLETVPVAISAYTSKTRDLIGIDTIQDMTNFTPGLGLLDIVGSRLHPRRRSAKPTISPPIRELPHIPTAFTTPASWPLRAMRCSRIESKFYADRRAPYTAATPSPAPSIPLPSGRHRIGPREVRVKVGNYRYP